MIGPQNSREEKEKVPRSRRSHPKVFDGLFGITCLLCRNKRNVLFLANFAEEFGKLFFFPTMTITIVT